MPVTIRKRSRTTPPAAAPAAPGHNLSGLQLRIEYLAISSLKLPARALRKHGKKQLTQIEASIRRFGNIQPLVVDGDGTIVTGSARYQAAQQLKLSHVPTIRIEHLSDEDLRLFALADNKLAEGAQWDTQLLAVELKELMLLEYDLEITGFDTVEIEQLVLDDPSGGPVETEEVPEPGAGPSVAQIGDLFALGDHKLLCGDARLPESYAALLGAERARMVFGDLPYNVKIDRNVSGLGKVKHGEFVAASGEMTPDEFTTFKREIMMQLVAYSMPGSIHYLCMDWRHQLEMMQAGNAVYTELKNLLVWVKTNAGMSAFYRSQHELIYAWKNGTAKHVNNFGLGENGRYRTNVLSYPGCNTFRKGRDEDLALHSTVKPTQLVADLIRDVSRVGEIVLDPCGGSGTTILAAERVKRKARCIELDPKYVDTSIRRCQDKLGVQAVHIASGLTFDELALERGVGRPSDGGGA